VVPSEELIELKQKHIISGTIRRSDGIQVRVVSDAAPSPDAQRVSPTLEDVYLSLVSQSGAGQ
jgi:ABC-2 type transport system ATP-binding protein